MSILDLIRRNEADSRRLDKAERELAELRRAPEVRVAARRQTEADLAKRRALVERLAALDAQAEADAPKLVAAVATAESAVRTAQANLAAAEGEYYAARAAQHSAHSDFDAVRSRLEGQLIETADPQIAEFIAKCGELLEATRRELYAEEQRGPKNLITQERTYITVTNIGSVKQRTAAISQAVRAAEALRFTATKNILEELNALRANIPPIDARFEHRERQPLNTGK